jgi:nucleotide-binding universal stress UspA family protein
MEREERPLPSTKHDLPHLPCPASDGDVHYPGAAVQQRDRRIALQLTGLRADIPQVEIPVGLGSAETMLGTLCEDALSGARCDDGQIAWARKRRKERNGHLILIPYDGSSESQSAIDGAGELVGGEPATVLAAWEPFIDVVARAGAGLGLAPGIVSFDEIDKAYEESARKRAAEGVERAQRAGLNAKPCTRTRRTTIAEAILGEADGGGSTAIILGTRGLTGIESPRLGSVSDAVLQHADRPVIVVPSAAVTHERTAHRR